jgi:sialate O-acetylesterase
MITDWRQRWGEGDFPFLFVQLAKFKNPNPGFAEVRKSQLRTLELPNTGMATAVDIGDLRNIHPKDKIDVGKRLALAARHVAYGETLVYSGPIFDKITVSGDKVRVSFTQLGGGLVIGTAPWAPVDAPPLSTTNLVGFTIVGSDGKWVDADAIIDGDTVVVSSPQVPKPVAVRYAFDNPTGNLYNKEELPASPFRSDKGAEAWHGAPAPAPKAPLVPAPAN